MNEESQIPSIEPELEARIVALVLGEASDFETEELNRLIEHRPELASFKLRMQRVHGLLQDVGEGESAAPDEDWQLPADKRNAVLAVIRGEATVPAATQDVSRSARRVSDSKIWLWKLTGIAAIVCVAGFVGLMALSPVFTPQSTPKNRLHQLDLSIHNYSAPASTVASNDQATTLQGGSDLRFQVEDGRAGAVVVQPREQSGWGDADDRKISESALSAIRQTLGADPTLPHTRYLEDDIQYIAANPEFQLPEDAATRHAVSELGKPDRASIAIVDGLEPGRQPAPQTADDSALIARNDATWSIKRFLDSDRPNDSQPNVPRAGNGELTVPMVADSFGEISNLQSTTVPEQSAVDLPDDGTSLPGGIKRPSRGSRVQSGGSTYFLSPGIIFEDEEMSITGLPQGSAIQNRTLGFDDAASPNNESRASLDFDFDTPDFPSPASGSERGQAQAQWRDGEETSRKFSKNRMASPADANGNGIVDERFENETKWMESIDVAGTPEPAGGTAGRSLGNLFGNQRSTVGGNGTGGFGGGGIGRGGTANGSGGFGGMGSEFGLNPLSDEWSKEMPANSIDIADGEMNGIASFDASGLEKSSRSRDTGRGPLGETSTAVESDRKSIDSLQESTGASDPTNEPESLSAAVRKKGKRVVPGKDTEELETKSDEMPVPGDAAPYDGLIQDNLEANVRQAPAPVTGTAVGQPPVNFSRRSERESSEIAESRERLPSKEKAQEFELQRKSGKLANERFERRHGYVPRTLNDSSDSMKRLEAKTVAPSAGLDEKVAADEAFSTFSLHVSDVSFKLALAALARGEWPEAAKVRIEEFVNAFDYGDPMPCKGEKVACRVEQSIHPFVQQRNLLRVSMRTAAAGRSSNTPLRLTFLLDNSGSMERIDRQRTVRRAFALLAQQLTPIDQVTLISFARQPRLLADKVSGSESGQLVRLIDELPSEGGTNIEAALQLAFEKAREQHSPGAQNRIILLTDGAVNLGDANPESLSRMVTTMRGAGIAFDAAGISAEGLNDEVLEALTRKGDGRYYLLDSLEAADDGFARQIAGALRPSAKNVKVQIEFNPKRVGRYKLLGFEKHILKKEDFRNDKVDAAEMAAAEAGVALYQFEARPDGKGDVGSVSVRFRDLSTGQMIENRWPIPYEAGAPRPDQAAPSLRIATSAALLAAKLRGEPLGESVDLRALSHLISGLPEQDRNDTRVQQLQQMIEQARQLSGK